MRDLPRRLSHDFWTSAFIVCLWIILVGKPGLGRYCKLHGKFQSNYITINKLCAKTVSLFATRRTASLQHESENLKAEKHI